MPGPWSATSRSPGLDAACAHPDGVRHPARGAGRCRPGSRRSVGSPVVGPDLEIRGQGHDDGHSGRPLAARASSATSATTTDRSRGCGWRLEPALLAAGQAGAGRRSGPVKRSEAPRIVRGRPADRPGSAGPSRADSAVERMAASGLRISWEASATNGAGARGPRGWAAGSVRPGSRRRHRQGRPPRHRPPPAPARSAGPPAGRRAWTPRPRRVLGPGRRPARRTSHRGDRKTRLNAPRTTTRTAR